MLKYVRSCDVREVFVSTIFTKAVFLMIIIRHTQYLVSDMGWSTNREAKTQHHARRLRDEADEVEGCGSLVRCTVETQSAFHLIYHIYISHPVNMWFHHISSLLFFYIFKCGSVNV